MYILKLMQLDIIKKSTQMSAFLTSRLPMKS